MELSYSSSEVKQTGLIAGALPCMMRFWWGNIFLLGQMLWICPACEKDDTARWVSRAQYCEAGSWNTFVTTTSKVWINPKQISVPPPFFLLCSFLTQTTKFTKIYSSNWQPFSGEDDGRLLGLSVIQFPSILSNCLYWLLFYLVPSDIFFCETSCGILYVFICLFLLKHERNQAE